ncbi:MAG: hypothetical protein RDV41_11165 [Planctomycetota bacterium]|nr:hypothetical protein [Planctomycetota bacterium]
MSKAVLITGFEPFNQFRVNSSWEGCRLVGKRMPAHVIARRLPVDHLAAREKLIRCLARHRPAICLCTGLTSSATFHIERVARKPVQFHGIRGPRVLKGAWPWDEMAEQLRKAKCPAVVSNNAGQYVCESTYWTLLAFRQQFGYPVYAGFLHVPPLSAVVTVEMIAKAAGCIIRARLEDASDATHPKGRNPGLGPTTASTRRAPHRSARG